MVIDILQQLIEFLNINCSMLANNCNYPTPFESLFYLVFFPSIFLILFIYVISDTVVGRFVGSGGTNRGMRLLIGVAIYIYIIINEWFTMIIPISQIWFILIIVLGGLWWFIGKHFGGGGSGGTTSGTMGKIAGGGGLFESMKNMTMSQLKGQINDQKKRVESNMRLAKNAADQIARATKSGGSAHIGEMETEFSNRLQTLKESIEELEKLYKLRFPYLGEMNIKKQYTKSQYWNKYNQLIDTESKELKRAA